MIVIVRRFSFYEEPVLFSELKPGTFFISQKSMQTLGDAAPINVKLPEALFANCKGNAVCVENFAASYFDAETVVYKGK